MKSLTLWSVLHLEKNRNVQRLQWKVEPMYHHKIEIWCDVKNHVVDTIHWNTHHISKSRMWYDQTKYIQKLAW